MMFVRNARRTGLAVCLLLALSPGGVRAEAEEVEAYESLAELTMAADAVILGQVIAAAPGRVFSGCGYTAAAVLVDEVLAGATPALAPALTLEYFGGCGPDLPRLGEEIPQERAVFFLRNKGVELRAIQQGATQAEIEGESVFWRLAIRAATVVDRSGRAHVPETMNAPFLAALEGESFDAVVGIVRRAADPQPGEAAVDPGGPPWNAWIIAAVVAVLLASAVVWVLRARGSRDLDAVASEAADPVLGDLVAHLERLRYPASHPAGSDPVAVDSVDLALTDGDVGALIHGHVSGEPWDAGRARSLLATLRDLELAIPHLEGEAKAFFDLELQIVHRLARLHDVPLA